MPLAGFLKNALGERYRIVLVDKDNPNCGLTVSGQGIVEMGMEELTGSGILSDILNSKELKKRDYLCTFSDSEKDEVKKSSIFYIRDKDGEIIGFLCIYEKGNNLYTVREVLDQLLISEEAALERPNGSGRIGKEVDSLLRERIAEVWDRHNASGGKMKKADKVAFVEELFDSGVFRMKNAAVWVSEVTGISQASIYRYLGEIIEK